MNIELTTVITYDIKGVQILNASDDIVDAINDCLDSGVEKAEP